MTSKIIINPKRKQLRLETDSKLLGYVSYWHFSVRRGQRGYDGNEVLWFDFIIPRKSTERNIDYPRELFEGLTTLAAKTNPRPFQVGLRQERKGCAVFYKPQEYEIIL